MINVLAFPLTFPLVNAGMSSTTLKIKTKLWEKGETFADLAERWGYSRALVTKVAHRERFNADVQRRLARYVGVPVAQLFGEGRDQRAA